MEQPAKVGRTPRDMAISMAVLLLTVFALVGLYRLLGHEDPPQIDTSGSYEAARAASAFAVASPAPPAGWRVQVSAYQRRDGGSLLRIGWQTADGGSVQLIQSDIAPDTLLRDELGAGAREEGTVDVNGRAWQRYLPQREGQSALVLREERRTVIIFGRAFEAELKTLAATL